MDANEVSGESHEDVKGVLRLDAGRAESHSEGKIRQALENVGDRMLRVEGEALRKARR